MADEELSTVLEPPTPAAIRDELQRLVIADLHGPQARSAPAPVIPA